MKLEQTTIVDFIKNPSLVPSYKPTKLGKVRLWTKAEDDFLKANWDNSTSKEIAKTLKRSVESVRFRGNAKLHLVKREVRHFTDKEVNFIKKNFDKYSVAELSRQLDRGVGVVRIKASRLGLKKGSTPNYWNKDQIHILKYMRKESFPTKVIAHVLSRPIHSIRNKTSNLGI